MNLKEIIVKKHNELTSGLSTQGFYNITTEDIEIMIADSENQSYDYYLQMSPKSAIIKLLIESAKAYGEAKWNEAIAAASDSFCSESPAPPKFIP